MDRNRYEPPRSGFRAPPREPGSIVKAVLLGAATDIGGTFVCSVVISIVYGLVLTSQGLSSEEITKTLHGLDPWSAVGIIQGVFGCAMSVLGGYVCARTAHRNSYTPLGILSAVSVALGTYLGAGDYQWSTLLALNLLTLAAIFSGGWWYMRRFQRSR